MEFNRMKIDAQKYHCMPLPENIEREVAAGNFDTARKMIDWKLSDPKVPEVLKTRMLIELDDMRHLEDRYNCSPDRVIELMEGRGIFDFTKEELENLRMKGVVDYRYINGELKYISSAAGTLARTDLSFRHRIRDRQPDGVHPCQIFADTCEDGQKMEAHIHIRHTLAFDEELTKEGKTLIVHMPAPKEGQNDQMKNVKIISTSHKPFALCEGDTKQPTVCFKEKAEKGMVFSIEYELDHVLTYHDPEKMDLDAIAKAELPEEVKPFLEEKLPHIAFTPFMRELCKEIIGEETNPLKKARLIYNYVTTQVIYRFAPNYASISNCSEYCAVNGRGDCGIQALLLITLMRIAGIPAVWQSGLDAKPNDVGEHDWARYYIPGIGWLCTDPSYGGSAYREGNTSRWNFFFANFDPYRIPLNDDLGEPFYPEKNFVRFDPVDSQPGEAEYEDEECLSDVYSRDFEDLGICLK